MKNLLLLLDDPRTPAAIRKEHRASLVEVIAQGEAALEARAAARLEQKEVSRAMAVWRDEANTLLLKVEGELKSIAADRRLGRGWVDKFFPQTPARRSKSTVETARAV